MTIEGMGGRSAERAWGEHWAPLHILNLACRNTCTCVHVVASCIDTRVCMPNNLYVQGHLFHVHGHVSFYFYWKTAQQPAKSKRLLL